MIKKIVHKKLNIISTIPTITTYLFLQLAIPYDLSKTDNVVDFTFVNDVLFTNMKIQKQNLSLKMYKVEVYLTLKKRKCKMCIIRKNKNMELIESNHKVLIPEFHVTYQNYYTHSYSDLQTNTIT